MFRAFTHRASSLCSPPRHSVLLFLIAILPALTVRTASAQSRDEYRALRLLMVKKYIEKEGITNPEVLKSMRSVPRHAFTRPADRKYAYLDNAMPIGHKQTISPPYIVAYMTQTIDPQPTDRVLEIGTGSGYQAAVLSGIVKEVYTIEIVPQLGNAAGKRLQTLGYKNVKNKVGDGFKGWETHAPFDKIIVTCSPENIPQPLIDQLKEGGKMLIPLGERYQQVFHLLEKKDGKLIKKRLVPTLFVPMTGISEDKRKVKPDPENPEVVNGSFEIDENNDDKPDNWHYQRHLKYRTTGAAAGNRYVEFTNDRSGQLAQLLQGMALDGRKIHGLRVSAQVKYQQAAIGTNRETPAIIVYYFDSNRKIILRNGIGPFVGTNRRWTRYSKTLSVPVGAREAIIQVGLNGGTGSLSIDHVSITPLK